jgi:hypothetical protein
MEEMIQARPPSVYTTNTSLASAGWKNQGIGVPEGDGSGSSSGEWQQQVVAASVAARGIVGVVAVDLRDPTPSYGASHLW